MHVAVIAEIELGSHKAHAINVVKTAGGFTRLGHKVSLLCRKPADSRSIADLLAHYAEPDLNVLFEPPQPGPAPQASLRLGRWAAATAREIGADLVYARHYTAPVDAANLGLPSIMETHAHVDAVNPLLDQALLATRSSNPIAITTINRRLRDHYILRGAHPNRVHLTPDGVDLDLFSPRPAPNPFTSPAPNLLYSGHLYDYKGIPTILAAAARRPSFNFHLLGGTPEDLVRVRAAAASLPNVTLQGRLPHSLVPPYLWHADLLLLPPSASDPSAAWTSPVKLGEYLASQRPILASRIPGLTDWVDTPAVTWFTPDDPDDLLRAADFALNESAATREQRIAAAIVKACDFSYKNRARQIIDCTLPEPITRRAS